MVKESVIRLFTRLAQEHGAINLSQGFPNEPPPWEVRLALAHGVVTGQPPPSSSSSNALSMSEALCAAIQTTSCHDQDDIINQYCPPMGRPDLRRAIADYYQRFYQYEVHPENVTVTLGATEALASSLRTIGRPGDRVVVLEPFHEIYPSQCQIFYLEPVYVTLRADKEEQDWKYNVEELEQALTGAKILLLNTPHNPTGKVFTRDELEEIVTLCIQHDVVIITDEIYEHMCFGSHRHYLLPKEFPQAADRILICNSLGKSASATGWRLGWCVHPPHLRDAYRGIHDQLALMSPHPMQQATLTYLTLSDDYFASLSQRYRQRVRKLAAALTAVGFVVVAPQGAYYLFVQYRNVTKLQHLTCHKAAMYLLTTVKVACVPGTNFHGGSNGDDYLRFAACRSHADLDEAAHRLLAVLKN